MAEETTDASWHQFHKDLAHAGSSTSDTPDSNTVTWISPNVSAIGASSPVIADGMVFVNCANPESTSSECWITALDLDDGTFLWNTSMGEREWGSWASPAYHDGKVFTSLGKVTKCLYASNGTEIWSFTTEEASCNGSPAIADGKVFVNDWQGGHYYCLNEVDGTEIWNFPIYGASETGGTSTGKAQGTVAYVDGLVYMTSGCDQNIIDDVLTEGFLYCVDADTGEEYWNQTFEHNVYCSPAVVDGVVYLTTYNFYGTGDVYAVDASNGDILWQEDIWRTDSTPAVAYGNVYTSGGYQRGKVFCRNASNGDLLWETDGNDIGGWTLSVAVADGKVFAGAQKKYSDDSFDYEGIYVLDATNGDILWSNENGGSCPAIYDGTVFTIAEGGRVVAYGGGSETVDITAEMSSITNSYLGIEQDIDITILNEGSTFANDVLISLKIDNVEIANQTISCVGGGSSQDITFTWLPESVKTYDVEVFVDPLDNIIETDESNNDVSISVTVLDGNPDLVPVSITPDQIYINQPYEMTATVSNTGYDVAESFVVEIKDGSDLVESKTISSLGPGEVEQFTFTWTASSTGFVYLSMNVDSTDMVVEESDSNNADSYGIDVEASTAIEVLQSTDWAQFQLNWLRNGTVGSYAAQEAVEEWSASGFNGEIDVTPVIVDDTVYVIASSGSVCAYDKNDGSLTWKKETESSMHKSTPAYGDGNIFVATAQGDLYSFDSSTGYKRWSVSVTNSSFESPVTYYDHRIYVADGLSGDVGTKYYYCYDDLGNLVWKYGNNNSAGFIWNGAVIVGDYLVYPVFEGRLVSLDRVTGDLVDEVNLSLSSDVSFAQADPGNFRSSVSYCGGYLYTTSERGDNGYLWKVGFDGSTGSFLNSGWSVDQGFSTSTPAILNGRVYVGQGEHGVTGKLNCFDDSTGTLLWDYSVDKGVKSSPAIATYYDSEDEVDRTLVYFTEAQNDGSMFCIMDMGDYADTVWEYNPEDDDGYILQGAAISDGLVYFGTDGGKLYCIGSDWNPWDDVRSAEGRNIAIDEVIEAYNCWRNDDLAPYTDYGVSIDDVISMYNAWRYNTPMA
ncbi:outer membrane protein assembly factor BamB family protein [Methanolobus profundi]|nr:PQQ-binding-like beta-propeller repeat protein [Methanolobus profundi]